MLATIGTLHFCKVCPAKFTLEVLAVWHDLHNLEGVVVAVECLVGFHRDSISTTNALDAHCGQISFQPPQALPIGVRVCQPLPAPRTAQKASCALWQALEQGWLLRFLSQSPRHPAFNDGQVIGCHLHADAVETFQHCCHQRCARPCEGVKHCAVGGCHHAH